MKLRLLTASVSLVLAAGCFTTSIQFEPGVAGAADPMWDGKWHHGAVYGLVELSDPVPLDKICNGSVASVEQGSSFVNLLVQGLVFNMYNPQYVTVYCSSGASAEVAMDGDGKAMAVVPMDGETAAAAQAVAAATETEEATTQTTPDMEQ